MNLTRMIETKEQVCWQVVKEQMFAVDYQSSAEICTRKESLRNLKDKPTYAPGEEPSLQKLVPKESIAAISQHCLQIE